MRGVGVSAVEVLHPGTIRSVSSASKRSEIAAGSGEEQVPQPETEEEKEEERGEAASLCFLPPS